MVYAQNFKFEENHDDSPSCINSTNMKDCEQPQISENMFDKDVVHDTNEIYLSKTFSIQYSSQSLTLLE